MFILSWKFSYTTKRSTNIFVGNMANVGISVEEKCHPKQTLSEDENLRDGEFYVYLN